VWPSENDVGSPDIVLTNEPDIDQQQRLRVVDVLLRIRSEVLA
jgi:hypothetical protein